MFNSAKAMARAAAETTSAALTGAAITCAPGVFWGILWRLTIWLLPTTKQLLRPIVPSRPRTHPEGFFIFAGWLIADDEKELLVTSQNFRVSVLRLLWQMVRSLMTGGWLIQRSSWVHEVMTQTCLTSAKTEGERFHLFQCFTFSSNPCVNYISCKMRLSGLPRNVKLYELCIRPASPGEHVPQNFGQHKRVLWSLLTTSFLLALIHWLTQNNDN